MLPLSKLIKNILILSFFLSLGLGCIEDIEVELWDTCYSIETTTFLNFSYQDDSDCPPLYGEIHPEIGQLVNMTDLYLGGVDAYISGAVIGGVCGFFAHYTVHYYSKKEDS